MVVDRGYAWVVLACAFVGNVVLGMLMYSTGIVNTAVLKTMEGSVVATSWIGSSLLGTVMLSGPLSGFVTAAVGCRWTTVIGGLLTVLGLVSASFSTTISSLIVTYGVIVGVGLGLIATAGSVSIGHYFDKLRPLAAGIQVSGAGCGMLFGAPLVTFLMDNLGFSGMMLILGGISAHVCATGLLLRPSTYEKPPITKRDEELKKHKNIVSKHLKTFSAIAVDFCKLFREYAFLIYVLSYMLWSLGESAFLVHLPHFVETKGTSPNQAALLFTAMGITSLSGRILGGFAGSDPAIGTLVLHTGMLGVSGILISIVPLMSGSFLRQLIMAAMYGLYSGAPMALLNPIVVQVLGVKRLALGYGMNNLFGGVGMLLGPPVTGLIYEIFHNFSPGFVFAGCVVIFASLVSLLIPVLQNTEGPKLNTHLDQTYLHEPDDTSKQEGETMAPFLHQRVMLGAQDADQDKFQILIKETNLETQMMRT